MCQSLLERMAQIRYRIDDRWITVRFRWIQHLNMQSENNVSISAMRASVLHDRSGACQTIDLQFFMRGNRFLNT